MKVLLLDLKLYVVYIAAGQKIQDRAVLGENLPVPADGETVLFGGALGGHDIARNVSDTSYSHWL